LNLTPEEKRVFGQLFRQADTEGIGVVTGEVAVKFFEKTRLEPRVLGEVCSAFSLCERNTRLILLHRYGRLQIRRIEDSLRLRVLA
jgi:hypothetical protein